MSQPEILSLLKDSRYINFKVVESTGVTREKSCPTKNLEKLTELLLEISTFNSIFSTVPLLHTNGKLIKVLHVNFNLT